MTTDRPLTQAVDALMHAVAGATSGLTPEQASALRLAVGALVEHTLSAATAMCAQAILHAVAQQQADHAQLMDLERRVLALSGWDATKEAG